ncbi:MAG: hypothetical protein R6U84_07690, partial [Candidatus Cloacimonadales bacterium]
MNNIIDLIKQYQRDKIILVPHINADLDAIASCYILSTIFDLPIGLLNRPVENGYNFIQLLQLEVK